MSTVQFQRHADGAALVRRTHHHTYVVKTLTTGRVMFLADDVVIPMFPRTKATRELLKAHNVLEKCVKQYAAAVEMGNRARTHMLPVTIRRTLTTL